MKKTILNIFSVFALFLVALIGFAGCSSDNANNNKPGGSTIEEPGDQDGGKTTQKITISFDSRYGILSFKSIERELTDSKIYLDETDFPTISNEGDERILDKWVYDNGVEFSSDIPIEKDISLHATFVDSEFIWVTTWDKYMDSITYSKNAHFIMEGIYSPTANIRVTTVSDPSSSRKNSYKKIKKSECLDEYITKDELKQFASRFCFVTSSNGKEKIVTESDVTTNVYEYKNIILIGESYFGYDSVGLLPKGCNLYEIQPNVNAALRTYLQYYCKQIDEQYPDTTQYKSSFNIDRTASKHYIVKSDKDRALLSVDDIREQCNNESYECNYDFQDDYYYGIIVCDYIYYNLKDETTNSEYFSFMAKDWADSTTGNLIRKTNCTEEEFVEFKNRFNLENI